MKENSIKGIWQLVLLLIAICSSACIFFNSDVHYVLPNGFVGMFKIILDESNGIDVQQTNGRYVYEIPPDGILRVKSFAPLRDLHEEKITYQNGTKIPIGTQAKSDVKALRSAGVGERSGYPLTMTLVIGTEKQVFYTAQQKQADYKFDEIPPLVFNERLKQIK